MSRRRYRQVPDGRRQIANVLTQPAPRVGRHVDEILLHGEPGEPVPAAPFGVGVLSFSELLRALKSISIHQKLIEQALVDDLVRARDFARGLPVWERESQARMIVRRVLARLSQMSQTSQTSQIAK